jgi:hypothetical protein
MPSTLRLPSCCQQVESLAASRQSGAGSEPADSVRAVNALLTQLDALKGHTNVMVRCRIFLGKRMMCHAMGAAAHSYSLDSGPFSRMIL